MQSKKTNWQAQWIWHPLPCGENTWMCFRRKFDLEVVPARVIADIAAESRYWLWINGKLAVREGGLKRGPNRQDGYYDTLDMASLLQKGKNTIAVLVWYWGRHGFNHQSSGKPGFLLEAGIPYKPQVSDTSWKCQVHPAFGYVGDPKVNWRYPESDIRFSAMNDIPQWMDAEYDDTLWENAVEQGTPPCAPWNRLWERPIPFWKDFGVRDYENCKDFPAEGTGEILHAKLPYNAQVSPILKVDAPEGLTIHIQTDHYVDPDYDDNDRRNLRVEYVTKNGVQEFECPEWINGHEVEYRIPAGVKIHSLQYRETGYAAEFSGGLNCDDDRLNALRKKSLRTLYVCMGDYFMDCPDRERAQWGDFAVQMHQALYALEPQAHGLMNKAFRETFAWTWEDGTIRIPVPNGVLDQNFELPVQCLLVCGRYGVWTYYLHTGDQALLREAYPVIKRYLDLWQIASNGLLIHRKGSWDWNDWGEKIDAVILQTVWYYLACESAGRIARILKLPDDAEMFDARRAGIQDRFNSAFWKDTHYASGDFIDDRANAMAVLAGFADKTQWDAIAAVLDTHKNASPFMEKFVAEALFTMNRPQQALERLKTRFSEMIDDPCTTLWENWRKAGGSRNHAWSGGALVLLPQYAAGIAPLAPGFTEYTVRPQPGVLQQIQAKVSTIQGEICVQINRTPDIFSLNLTSPAKTKAMVAIPFTTRTKSIQINGKKLWQNGVFRKGTPGISKMDDEVNYIRFQVDPGQWEFIAGEQI